MNFDFLPILTTHLLTVCRNYRWFQSEVVCILLFGFQICWFLFVGQFVRTRSTFEILYLSWQALQILFQVVGFSYWTLKAVFPNLLQFVPTLQTYFTFGLIPPAKQ